ncbi:MAG TPA: response regulator [Planctomycetota bacterium]|nr:response regulator [Planctomycetota bacterium]
MVENQLSVLFGEPDLASSQALREKLEGEGIRIAASTSSREILELAGRHKPEVVVLDDRLEMMGSQVFISLFRRHCPDTRIILLLPEGTHPDRESLRHLEPVCCLVRPVADHDLLSVLRAAIKGAVPSGEGAKPPLILCVDDDERFLKSLVRVLRRPGYAVVSYDNPEEALEAIPILQPDLAFIDVLMPGMNGLDLASEIREDYGEGLPLVLLSARSSDREIADGYRSGATRYITKPCEPETLLNVAEQLLPKDRPGRKEMLRPTRG